MKNIFVSFLTACALSAYPIVVGFVPKAQARGMGENASGCISLEGYNIQNSCNFTVEVTWCVENYDCNDGKFTNTWTLGPGRMYPVQGSNTGNQVHWGACRGANTLSTNGTQPYSYTFNCE